MSSKKSKYGFSWDFISLSNVERQTGFPYRLDNFGLISNITGGFETYKEKFEIAIRIASTDSHCTDIINGITYHTPYPNAVLKIPGVEHSYRMENPRDAFHLTYDPELYERFKSDRLLAKVPVWPIEINSRMKSLMRDMLELMDRLHECGISDRLDLLGFTLFEELIFTSQRVVFRDGDIEAKLYKISSYLQMNFNKHLDIDSLIEGSGLSRRSFFRHWKKHFSLPPMLYIQELRLQEACRLLQSTSKKIFEISENLCFEDNAYFSRLFRKRFGMTPLQYRRRESVFFHKKGKNQLHSV